MFSLDARRDQSLGAIALLSAAAVLTSARADAHFKIDGPACWMSQDALGGPQKKGPCAAVADTALGDPQGTPTNMVTVEKSGTVTVSVTVTIAHPGWFRVSLAEGPSSSQTLTTLPDPVAVNGTNCTPALMRNLTWSPTQPIIADGLGLPAGSTSTTTMQTGTQTFQVDIPPAATCTSARPCTLQVIMMMTDHPVTDCYYHHCADIALEGATDASAGASTGEDSAAESSAESDSSIEPSDANAAGSSSSGGATTSASSSGAATETSGGSSSSGGSSGAQNSAGGGSSGSAGSSSSGVGGTAAQGSSGSESSGGSSEAPKSSGGCAAAARAPQGDEWALAALGLLALGSVSRRGRRR